MNIQDRFRKAHDPIQLEMFEPEPKENKGAVIGAIIVVALCIAVIFMV